MIHDDVIVYDDDTHYLGLVSGEWTRWPAQQGGWSERKRVSEPDADRLQELPPENASLALQLSGFCDATR